MKLNPKLVVLIKSKGYTRGFFVGLTIMILFCGLTGAGIGLRIGVLNFGACMGAGTLTDFCI